MKQTYAIGIDVGGSSLKCGIVNQNGIIIHSFLVPLDAVKTQEDVIELIYIAIQKCTEKLSEPPKGVGIGFPGIVDENIIIGGADNLPGFVNIPLADILKSKTGLSVILDNDANMMGLGEVVFGAAKESNDVVFLTVGTGIGGAIFINKNLYGGYRNRGTELGHIIIKKGGRICSCGSHGCLEAYASTSALVNHYKKMLKNSSEDINGKIVVERYLQGESKAGTVMNAHFDSMANGIASLINIFSPQKVVVGGGISEAGKFYIDEIIKKTNILAMPDAMKFTQIVAASLGNNAGLLGCAAKIFNHKTNNYEA